MTITKEQARVYQIIWDMFLKGICVIAGLVAFFWVLAVLLTSKDEWPVKAVYGAIECIFAGTLYKVYGHFFPKKKS